MTIYEAVNAAVPEVLTAIRRAAWPAGWVVMVLIPQNQCCWWHTNPKLAWNPTADDLLADDWETRDLHANTAGSPA